MRYETILRSALALSVVATLPASPAGAQANDKRSYISRGSTLEIDGKPVGTMQSVEGGYAKADVAATSLGADEFPIKRVTNVKFEPITVRGDVASLDDVARKAFEKPVQLNGRLTSVFAGAKAPGSSLEFFNAIPTKVMISDLDASSKDACYIEITLVPERAQRSDATSADSKAMFKQERCVQSSFSVKIPGVNTTGVSKVENIGITRELVADNVGVMREPMKHPTKVNVPNVVLTVAEGTAKDFWAWYDNTLIKGDHGQDKEKTIEILLSSSDRKSTFITLQGTGVGMVAMRPLGGIENIPKVEVELYVTKWAISGATP